MGLHFVSMNLYTAYLTAVASAAVLFCLLIDWSPIFSLSAGDLGGLLTFLLLAVLSQYLAIDSTLGAARRVKSSIAFVPLLAMAVVMPAPAVVITAGVMTAIDETLFRERDILRGVFNTSQTVLSFGTAAHIFHSLGFAPETGQFSLLALFLPFYTLSIVAFGLNMLLVSVAIALRQSESVGVVLRHAAGRGGGNFVSDLLSSPLALFAAYLYGNFHVPGLLLAVFLILYIRRSYLSGIHLQQANDDLLRVLVKAIETRDPYTSGHSVRVATLSKAIGMDYGLRPHILTHVERAALLHDIGKIDAQFAQIISKPAELSDEERSLIQSHATAGSELLETLTSVHKDVIAGVRHHHERYDGTGYPDGLQGSAIPIAARIIMIADSIDAMLSDRPYRDALSVADVYSELSRCSGTQFDPALVKAILSNNTLERAEILVEDAGANGRREAASVPTHHGHS